MASMMNRQEYLISSFQENIETIIYAGVCFFIPYVLGHPQYLVGVIVNASLVLAALNLKNLKIWPVILAPCLGVISKGLIFGGFTSLLLYMVPFIWAGNFILVYAIKELVVRRKLNRIVALGTGAVAKTVLLFGAAFAMFHFGILPALFLTTMGLMQLYTAVAGGLLAFGIQYAKARI